MNNFNKEELSNLLKQSLEGRTQKKFASEIGVSSEYLNRLINQKYKNPPSEDFLNKVSKNTKKVSMEQLLKACGYGYNINKLEITHQDLLSELIHIIKNNKSTLKKELLTFDSLTTLLNKLNENFYFSLFCDIIKEEDNNVLVKSEISYNAKKVVLYYVIEYIKTNEENYLLKNVFITKNKIDSMFKNSLNYEFIDGDNYYYKNISLDKENETIISFSNNSTFIDTIKGYGFRVNNSSKLYKYTVEELNNLAKRITNETGIKLNYIEDDLIKENNSIMYVTDDPPSEMIKKIFENYKDKLEIKNCGFCYIYKQKKVIN